MQNTSNNRCCRIHRQLFVSGAFTAKHLDCFICLLSRPCYCASFSFLLWFLLVVVGFIEAWAWLQLPFMVRFQYFFFFVLFIFFFFWFLWLQKGCKKYLRQLNKHRRVHVCRWGVSACTSYPVNWNKSTGSKKKKKTDLFCIIKRGWFAFFVLYRNILDIALQLVREKISQRLSSYKL